MTVDDLATPCLLIDEQRMSSNVARMQELAYREGVHLRPHTKTHKSPEIAGRQEAAGAIGLTVAKVGEAEVFVAAGFRDVRIAYDVVGGEKYERISSLQDSARISVCVDTVEGARLASEFFAARERTLEVLVEVDTGHGRCGVPWDDEDSIRVVQVVRDMPGLRYVGILTHAGHAYHGPRSSEETVVEALARASEEEVSRMLRFASRLAQAGLRPDEISIGSTPSMARFRNRTIDGLRITEIRPGNYVLNDAIQVGLGSATLQDCALTVLTTVVSRRRDRSGSERIFLDAGKKTVTADTGYGTSGYGLLLYNPRTRTPLPHAVISALSEEHAWVDVHGGSTLQVGDRAEFVPNHACVAANLQDTLYLTREGEVIGQLHVEARGRVT